MVARSQAEEHEAAAKAQEEADAAEQGLDLDPEDGTVEFFTQLLEKMGIKAAKAEKYAKGLVEEEYDLKLFNEATEQELKEDFGFVKGDIKRVISFRAEQRASSSGMTKDAANLRARDFGSLTPEQRTEDARKAIEKHRPGEVRFDSLSAHFGLTFGSLFLPFCSRLSHLLVTCSPSSLSTQFPYVLAHFR